MRWHIIPSIIILLTGCVSYDKADDRYWLQKRNPDCYVEVDLTLVCPDRLDLEQREKQLPGEGE